MNTFVFVGSCFLTANCPVKGYRHTSIRRLFDKLRSRRLCTVHEVDEFRTTKLCSLCFRVLKQPHQQGRINKKFRYYLCKCCKPKPAAKQAINQIQSRKSNRLLTEQRHERPRVGVRMASKYKRYTKRDATGRNRTWNRDVNAGRNIKYKGIQICKFEINWTIKLLNSFYVISNQ